MCRHRLGQEREDRGMAAVSTLRDAGGHRADISALPRRGPISRRRSLVEALSTARSICSNGTGRYWPVFMVGASAKSGIKHLVYAVAGYNPTAEEAIAAFKSYVQEEAKKYEPEFPNERYMQWHRLYDIPVPERGKPWHFKYLTVRHIYHPLAQSSGRVLAPLKARKAKEGDRAKKLFQFLSEIGARALRMHLGRVLEMAESSPSRYAYGRRIVERFGGQQKLELVVPSEALPPPASEDEYGARPPGT
jgi:hypothetical protein